VGLLTAGRDRQREERPVTGNRGHRTALKRHRQGADGAPSYTCPVYTVPTGAQTNKRASEGERSKRQRQRRPHSTHSQKRDGWPSPEIIWSEQPDRRHAPNGGRNATRGRPCAGSAGCHAREVVGPSRGNRYRYLMFSFPFLILFVFIFSFLSFSFFSFYCFISLLLFIIFCFPCYHSYFISFSFLILFLFIFTFYFFLLIFFLLFFLASIYSPFYFIFKFSMFFNFILFFISF
jgi:hypothetical protein